MRSVLALFLVACLGCAIAWPRPTGAGEKETEPGFTPLFNGEDLDGWKTKKGDEKLDDKTQAYGGRFKVEGGLLLIDPKVKGDVTIETAKEFAGDVHIKFEFNPGPKCNNDLFLRGIKFDIVPGN